jgi:pimeloyl-ACP methyl ester carboxylesterase
VGRNDAAMERSMVYRDYLRAVSLENVKPDAGPVDFAARLRRHTRDMAAEYMLGKEFDKLTEEDRVKWEGIQATPVFAIRDAVPAAGKFPVVMYHPGLGGTYEDNLVACEFLASRGYVVVSSAYQAADSTMLNINGDLSTSHADLSFLLRHAANLPFADIGKVAAIGHSYGAQAVLSWRAQPNSALDAVVFLDSTVEYTSLEEHAAFKASLERNRKSAAPVMMIADARRGPNFDKFDEYLGFAPRYEVTVDGMEHNDFVSQGAVRKDDRVRRNYEAMCAAIGTFLDAYLKGDAQALAALRNPAGAGPLGMKYREAKRALPTGAQIARLYTAEGPMNMGVLSTLVRSVEPEIVGEAADILEEQGRSREALGLLTWSVTVMPKSALLRAALGESVGKMGDKTGARKNYEQALALLPEDHTLEAGEKAVLEKEIERAMIALRKN